MDTSYQIQKQNYDPALNCQKMYNQFIKNSFSGSHLGNYNPDSGTSEEYMKMVPLKVNQKYNLN